MSKHTLNVWVKWNPLTQTYDTPDGTSVAGELVNNAQTMLDALRIATIRGQQRAAIAKATGQGGKHEQ